MALFRTLPTPTNDLLPSLMVEVCLVLDVNQMLTSSLILANKGYLFGAVFFLFFSKVRTVVQPVTLLTPVDFSVSVLLVDHARLVQYRILSAL